MTGPGETGIAQRSGAAAIQTGEWSARILPSPPLIAPARAFVFPQVVPGEEEALARGAMWVDLRLQNAPGFVAQCALGFGTGHVAHGLWQISGKLLALAGGYAYLIDPHAPGQTRLLPMRPTVGVLVQGSHAVLVGFHHVLILHDDDPWQSPRLSWEGVTLTACNGEILQGTGWDVTTDEDLPFALDLRTHRLTGGGYRT